MTPEQKQKIDHLWKVQDETHKRVQAIADKMTDLAKANVSVPQRRWDHLFTAWEAANKQMQQVGDELEKLHGILD